MKEISTEERLENGIKHQPDRYISTRGGDGKLIEVADRDTGRLLKKMPKGDWIWVE